MKSIKEDDENELGNIELEKSDDKQTSMKMYTKSTIKKQSTNQPIKQQQQQQQPSFYEKIKFKIQKIKCYHHAKLLFVIFLIIKLLYVINCAFQFVLLNQLIATENKQVSGSKLDQDRNEVIASDITFWNSKNILKGFQFGFKSFQQVYETGNLFGSRSGLLIFHTVIFCDFKIRTLGDRMHNFSVQCAVPINIFLEKIFIFLWVWFFILNFINVFSILKWLCFFFSYKIRLGFMLKHLNLSNYNLGIQELSKKEKVPETLFKRKISNFAKVTTEIITREIINLSLESFNKKLQFPNEDTV